MRSPAPGHEALIHGVDAEQTAGVPSAGLDPALAADGVAELLEVVHGGDPPSWGRFEAVPGPVGLQLTHTGHVLLASSGLCHGSDPVSGRHLDGPHVARVDDHDIERAGAADVQQAVTTAVDVRWTESAVKPRDATVEP